MKVVPNDFQPQDEEIDHSMSPQDANGDKVTSSDAKALEVAASIGSRGGGALQLESAATAGSSNGDTSAGAFQLESPLIGKLVSETVDSRTGEEGGGVVGDGVRVSVGGVLELGEKGEEKRRERIATSTGCHRRRSKGDGLVS